MTEERFLNGRATRLETALLASGTSEVPTSEMSAMMLAPLAGLAAAAAGSHSLFMWGATLVGGTLLAGGIVYSLQPSAPPTSTPPVRKPPVVVEPAPVKPIPSQKIEESNPKSAPKPAATPTRGDKLPARRTRSASTLTDEMWLLDQARGALKQGEPKKALRLLASYSSRFPKGTLKDEATVLRIQALKESGDSKQAASIRTEFLRSHPKSAHKRQLEREGE